MYKRTARYDINENFFDNLNIGIVKPNICGKLIEPDNYKDVISYKKHTHLLSALTSAEIDILCYPKPIIDNLINKHGLKNKVVTFSQPLKEITRGIGISKENHDILPIIDKAITELKNNGKYQKIYSSWFKSNLIILNSNEAINYVMLILILLFITPIYLNRKKIIVSKEECKNELEMKTNDLKQKNEFLDLVFNNFPYIAVISNKKEMINANNKALIFFKYASFDSLIKVHKCIYDFFENENGFITKNIKGMKWIDYILKYPKKYYALIKKEKVKHIFEVEIKNFSNDFFLIVLKDVTIEKNKLKKIKYQVEHDSLTKIYNRVKFNTILELELKRFKRNSAPSNIAILDIDHFKYVNDNYGHLIGDKVLIELSKLVLNNIRVTDIFARWGGEEFVLFMYNTNVDEAFSKVEDLRLKIENNYFSDVKNITCSFGVVKLEKNDTIDSVFKRCDDALFNAKKLGRNKVVVY